jgi:DNA recombination protein RmuC
MDASPLLSQPLVRVGASALTLGDALLWGGGLALGLLALAVVLAWRGSGRQGDGYAEEALADLLRAQAELGGKLGAVAQALGARQAELDRSLNARLDTMSGRLGQTLAEQARATHHNLTRLQERLATIDAAQSNIQSLAGRVVELQSILSNKQARGAFGQGRMEAIVADGLPPGAFEFQATLSNMSRPDCLIRMPQGQPALCIDAKFPLEAWNAIRAAADGDARRQAAQAFRRDIEIHIRDIAGKYLLPGETQDTAFMFVPSESVFAEIHENFEGVVQRAHRARVVIVSPSLLMLSIQVVQSLLKDARMREQAHLIQGEVARLADDVGRLDERVRRLQTHFGQAAKDVDEILVSASRVAKRGARIEAMELSEPAEAPRPTEQRPPAEGRDGRLRLRVVEDEA